MIRALQRKFVLTAMAAITVLILLLLGGINVANLVIVREQVQHTLEMLSNMNREGENPFPPSDPPKDRPMDGPKNAYDTFLSSNFFLVRFDQEGNVTYVDVTRTSSVTEEEAESMGQTAYEKATEQGSSGKFRYLLRENLDGRGASAVFLDTSDEWFSYLRVVLLSGAAGLVCWGLMLGLVIVLSRRAIRPIVENIQRQKQFVTNAGHELKTPLAIIQSNAEALELYTGETKWSRNIKDQAQRLGGLMNDLLTLARMDESSVTGLAVEVSLSDLAEKAAEAFAQPMEAKGLALEQEIQPGVVVKADPAQMEQLFSILLDNAVKYSVEGSTIRFSLVKEDRRARLTVENTCESLPQVPPEKLFDRFYRGDAARTQKSGGYGIGLAVAASIAAANKGSLQARYLPENRISFTAYL